VSARNHTGSALKLTVLASNGSEMLVLVFGWSVHGLPRGSSDVLYKSGDMMKYLKKH